MRQHEFFILTPLTDVLNQGLVAIRNIEKGITSFPLVDYLLQSIFLRMTGAQEQKLKCICWELATDDLEYRRKFLRGYQDYGEFSSIKAKNSVYKDLLDEIKIINDKFNPNSSLDIDVFITDTKETLINGFKDTAVMECTKREFDSFIAKYDAVVKKEEVALHDTIVSGFMTTLYDLLYKHRNRSAHNTNSLQPNFPAFESLIDPNHKYDNYYFRFTILILLDKIYMSLFEEYLDKY